MQERDAKIENVLVYGATGAQARPVARRLREVGFQVRAVTRNPDQAHDLVKLGAEVVAGDLADLPSLRTATAGVDAVFLLIPFGDPRLAYGQHAIDAAREAQVKLLVWNPTGTIPSERTGNPGVDVRLDIMEYLRESGLPHMVLQPTVYMENFLLPWLAAEVATDDTFAYPMPPDAFIQWVSHEDMAAFAVAAFRRPPRMNVVLQVSGPERLNGDDVAIRFSRALERPIRFRSMPPQEMGQHIEKILGAEAGEAVRAAYARLFADPTLLSTDVQLDTVIAQLPITPTSLEQWVRQHAEEFASDRSAPLA